MVLKLVASASSPPIGGILTASFAQQDINLVIEWGKDNILEISPGVTVDSNAGICRYLARIAPKMKFYGSGVLEETEVDHWISFSIGPLACSQEFLVSIEYLDQVLGPVTYLVGSQITIADLVVWGTLLCNQNWIKISEDGSPYKNINRWFLHIQDLDQVKKALSKLPEEVASKFKKEVKNTETKDEGKFVDLPGAEMGKVVVRFPPEASGFLHIGHAKAALLNQYYQESFKGKLIMRFDDTNPDKEKVDFEKVILEDLKLLQIKPDLFTHTSDYFDLILSLCEKMLKEGKAYVDDTDPETMKQEREQRKPSKNRDNTIEKNLSMWREMCIGSEYGQKCCVRAKMSMESDNGCMRDPTIYRCKNEPHPKTGTKYKVYPTYDFACPIVDSIEGVTHSLRTMEYHDRDEQFYWFIDALNLRKPHIWEYARLNMMNTVLSKRKLTWFVEQGIVDSWEDPRFPTVRGVLRRGMTVEGLRQFIVAQGSSRSVVQMEWDKIWAFNKKVIDPIAPRYTALEKGKNIVVNVSGAKNEELSVAKHPKNPDIGVKKIWTGPRILIDMADAVQLREGENATFINWGNLKINKINKDSQGVVTSIDAETNLSNTDFKKTLKLTWLAETEVPFTPIDVLYYEHIITKPVLAKDEDFKTYINYDSKRIVQYIGDVELRTLKTSDIIQLQRIGFFRCDASYEPNKSLVLIHIPDGSSKALTTGSKDLSFKEKATSSKGKKSEKSPVEETVKVSTADSKVVPVSNAELEQIGQQWSADRKLLIDQARGSTEVIGVERKSLEITKQNGKKESPGKIEKGKKQPSPDKAAGDNQKQSSVKKAQDKKKQGSPDKTESSKEDKKQSGKKQQKAKNVDKQTEKPDTGVKKQTRLGLEAAKEENLADWYSQVITKGDLIEYYDVSGCYILRPWSFALWEVIRDYIDKEIKALGVQNCYFPMFVSKSVLEKEKTHIADFAPEVAWVTKSGDSDLAEHIAIRPTSETVMYPAYAKWVQSYRDLPIKLNQWNNVVRWEFKHPQPFLRTREFLWQEGHTAYAMKNEAEEEVLQILDIYAKVYTDLLAVPVVKGRKTEKEKFAGGDYTTTVEAFISASGRAIQGATSHHLGQNFSKMFEIVYDDPVTAEKKYAYQNSWGMTTRTIGVMIMIHADNQGLVLPPRVACLQIVIVPCGLAANMKEEQKRNLVNRCKDLESDLRGAGIRVKLDDRDNYSPGWKFNNWELKGVPIRVELGPKDLEKEQLVAVRRDTGEKKTISLKSSVVDLNQLLNTIQENLLEKATKDLTSHTIRCKDWNEFCVGLDNKNILLSPFCGQEKCEDNIKKDSARDQDIEPGAPAMGAKSLCVPFDQPEQIRSGDRCIHPGCGNKPVSYTLFGRSY